MALVYEDWTDRSQVRVPKEPISTWDSPRVMAAWRVHADNRMYLEFMAKKGTFQERGQARKELLICDRKLTFWKKHPNWDARTAELHMVHLRTQWHVVPPHPPKED